MEMVPLINAWVPYILSPATTSGMAYVGPRLAVFVAAECAKEVGDCATMAFVLGALERLHARFEDVTGFSPPLTQSFRGRLICEVAHLPNAAGLAHHGRGGFAVGPAFLKESLESFRGAPGAGFLHHVFGYEMFRNFIHPDVFTPPFKSCCENDASWGWLNQGFVNICGCLCLSEGGIAGFSYFGQSSHAFRAGMEAQLLVYVLRRAGVGGAAVSWGDVWLRERLPWAPDTSLDNLYSGLLSVLFRMHGGSRFLSGFFRAVPLLSERCPINVRDYHTAAENIYLAACAGAGRDVWEFFEALGWPPRRAPCCAAVGSMLSA